MGRRYFFREGDFLKWHRAYLECKDYLRAYRTSYDTERRKKESELYKESLRIVEEHKILICSLNEGDVSYMNESIKAGYFLIEGLRLHPDLIDNWNEIVLNSGDHALVDVDMEALGSKLKGLRKDKGMCRAEVCRHLGIAERTLQSYEEGSREIGINNLYKLTQLYGVGDISGLLKQIKAEAKRLNIYVLKTTFNVD